ncbi:MAG: hypothetical protein JWM28_4160, partial [Chitinophagaceae bacterium]|nr:hypothetical protein [Chitinophagaceae bacterium]
AFLSLWFNIPLELFLNHGGTETLSFTESLRVTPCLPASVVQHSVTPYGVISPGLQPLLLWPVNLP